MSGSDYNVSCPTCGGVNTLRGKAMTLALTCKSCNTYFRIGHWNKATVEFKHEEYQVIPIGAKGRIDDQLYEVMGFVVKEESKYRYRWREYLLFNPFAGYAFLSEFDGHWNFIWPIEETPKKDIAATDFQYEGAEYRMYQRYTAHVVHARGEFFFDVFDITASTVNYEYIAPPFVLAAESSDDSILWCKGEYFEPDEIAKAFSIPKGKFPGRKGIGYTQPFLSTFSDKAIMLLTLLFVLITLTLQIFINSNAEDKVVFQREYRSVDLKDQKVIVTPTFELTGGTRSLEVLLYAPVDNDWFFSEFTLVNDQDGTEYNFTKEVGYYHGYEDGTSWTEGSKSAEAFLSQIPEGKYHLNIYPEFGFTNNGFAIVVSHDVPMTSNFYVATLGLLLFPIVFFVRKRYREQRRWRDSEYSPYETE